MAIFFCNLFGSFDFFVYLCAELIQFLCMNEVCVSKLMSAHYPVRLDNGVHFSAYTSLRKGSFVTTLLENIYKCTHARTYTRTLYLLRARSIFSIIIMMLLSLQLVTVKAQQTGTQQYTVIGTAQMNFPINEGRIHTDFAGNRQETDKLQAIIDLVLADTTATMQRIVICGYGSPDGSYAFNERVAKMRADGLRASVAEKASFPQNLIEVRYVAEDWEGLAAFVEAASADQLPHRNDLLKVIRSNRSADAKERIIRKQYPADFSYLKNNGLPQLRRSDYMIEYLTRDPNAVQAMNLIQQRGTNQNQMGGQQTSGVLAGQQQSQSNTASGQSNVNSQNGLSGTQTDSTDKIGQNESKANQLANSQIRTQSDSGGRIKWWELLLGGLLLLALIIAGFLIHRYKTLLEEKNDTINRMKYELRLLRNAAMKKEEEERRHKPVPVSKPVEEVKPVVAVTPTEEVQPAVPQAAVSQVPETVVAESDTQEAEIPVIPFVERPKTLVFGAESVVDDSERSFEDEKVTEKESETVEEEPETVVEEPETVAEEAKTVEEEPETVVSEEESASKEDAELIADDEESAAEEEETADKSDAEDDVPANSHDYERFLRMDQEVTEKKLYLKADLNRRKLMRIAGVDKNRFAMMMRKYAKTNFSGYINSKRMEYATQLITEHPEYTMKQVAEMCGFNSQSTFFRVFKSVFGITPIELSQNNKTSESTKNQEVISFPKSQSGQNGTPREQMIKFGADE